MTPEKLQFLTIVLINSPGTGLGFQCVNAQHHLVQLLEHSKMGKKTSCFGVTTVTTITTVTSLCSAVSIEDGHALLINTSPFLRNLLIIFPKKGFFCLLAHRSFSPHPPIIAESAFCQPSRPFPTYQTKEKKQ
jgi:hypothetical protein